MSSELRLSLRAAASGPLRLRQGHRVSQAPIPKVAASPPSARIATSITRDIGDCGDCGGGGIVAVAAASELTSALTAGGSDAGGFVVGATGGKPFNASSAILSCLSAASNCFCSASRWAFNSAIFCRCVVASPRRARERAERVALQPLPTAR